MNKLKVVIYATCQGNGISKFLLENNEFLKEYEFIRLIRNYENIHSNTIIINNNEIKSDIEKADVFIYQPLDKTYGENSTDHILSFIKSSCLTISIPYVFNTSFWPVVPALKGDTTTEWNKRDGYNQIILNIEVIDALIKKGFKSADILSMYDNNEIDFNYETRNRINMMLLSSREKNLDIKTHDFIKDNLKNKRLFLYSSHPTSSVFVHMTNQIFDILKLKQIIDNYELDFAGNGTPIPVAFPTSAVNAFDFKFTTKEEENLGNNYYKNIITKHINTKLNEN